MSTSKSLLWRTFAFLILNWCFILQYRDLKHKLSNLQLILENVVLNYTYLVFYLWTEKSWEKVRCKQVRLDKKLFWRKEFARYRQFPLCTGSIPYKNHEKTSVLHKMSVDDRFPLWTVIRIAFKLFYNEICSKTLKVYPFSVEICIGGTVGMSNFQILSVHFCSRFGSYIVTKSAVRFVLRWNFLNKIQV
jgi:hypothetical protein